MNRALVKSRPKRAQAFPPIERYLLTPHFMEPGAIGRMVAHGSRSNQRLERPAIVGWLVTNKCQLRCRHCWFDHHQPQATYEQRITIAHRLAEAGACRICLSGGEATLVPGLSDIVRIIKASGTPIALYTNAIDPLGRDQTCWMDHFDPATDYLQVSLDGGTRKDFERQRGPDTFERFLAGVGLLRERKARMFAHFIATPFNRARVHEAARLALRLGFEGFVAERFYARGRMLDASAADSLETARAFNASLEQLLVDSEIVDSPLKIGITFPRSLPLPDYVDTPAYQGSFRVSLLHGNAYAFVSPVGELVPEVHLQSHSRSACGSLLEHSFSELWAKAEGLAEFPTHRDLSGALCAQCPSFSLCRGGNFQRALEAFGTVDAHDPECYFATYGL